MFNFKPGRRSRQRPSVQDVLVNWVNDKGKGKGEKKGGKVAEAAEASHQQFEWTGTTRSHHSNRTTESPPTTFIGIPELDMTSPCLGFSPSALGLSNKESQNNLIDTSEKNQQQNTAIPESHSLSSCGCDIHSGRELLDAVYASSVNDVARGLFGDGGSEVMDEVFNMRGCDDVKIEKWATDKKGRWVRRRVTYKVQVKAPMYGTMNTLTIEDQRIIQQEANILVVDVTTLTPSLPYGTVFSTVQRYCITPAKVGGKPGARVLIHARTEFTKKLMLQDAVAKSAMETMSLTAHYLDEALIKLAAGCDINLRSKPKKMLPPPIRTQGLPDVRDSWDDTTPDGFSTPGSNDILPDDVISFRSRDVVSPTLVTRKSKESIGSSRFKVVLPDHLRSKQASTNVLPDYLTKPKSPRPQDISPTVQSTSKSGSASSSKATSLRSSSGSKSTKSSSSDSSPAASAKSSPHSSPPPSPRFITPVISPVSDGFPRRLHGPRPLPTPESVASTPLLFYTPTSNYTESSEGYFPAQKHDRRPGGPRPFGGWDAWNDAMDRSMALTGQTETPTAVVWDGKEWVEAHPAVAKQLVKECKASGMVPERLLRREGGAVAVWADGEFVVSEGRQVRKYVREQKEKENELMNKGKSVQSVQVGEFPIKGSIIAVEEKDPVLMKSMVVVAEEKEFPVSCSVYPGEGVRRPDTPDSIDLIPKTAAETAEWREAAAKRLAVRLAQQAAAAAEVLTPPDEKDFEVEKTMNVEFENPLHFFSDSVAESGDVWGTRNPSSSFNLLRDSTTKSGTDQANSTPDPTTKAKPSTEPIRSILKSSSTNPTIQSTPTTTKNEPTTNRGLAPVLLILLLNLVGVSILLKQLGIFGLIRLLFRTIHLAINSIIWILGIFIRLDGLKVKAVPKPVGITTTTPSGCAVPPPSMIPVPVPVPVQPIVEPGEELDGLRSWLMMCFWWAVVVGVGRVVLGIYWRRNAGKQVKVVDGVGQNEKEE